MIYQLPNGKCIDIPVELYLNCSDKELEYIIFHFEGNISTADPFYGSVIKIPKKSLDELSEDEYYEYLDNISLDTNSDIIDDDLEGLSFIE